MKKLLLLILSMMLFSLIFAQTDITIGTGTTTGRYPMNDYYVYSRSQCIYLESEIGSPGTINKLRWYRSDAGADANAIGTTQIWLKTVTNAVMTDVTWEDPGTLVSTIANIDLGAGAGWYEVDITDFAYTGGNLLVSVYTQNAPNTTPHSYWYYTATTGFNRCRLGNSDSVNPPTLALSTSRPNIQINMTTTAPSTAPNAAILSTPANNSWTFTGATLNWNSGGGFPSSYDVYFGTSATPPFVVNQAGTTYTPTLAAATTYYWKVVAKNGFGDATASPTWSFKTPTATQLAESFESTTFPPAGWANPGTWARSTSYFQNGVASAYKYGSSSTQYVLSGPKCTITGTSALNFWSTASSISGTLQVVYSPDRVTWTQIGTNVTYATANTMVNTNIDLSSLAGNNYYIGFRTGLYAASYYIDSVFGPEITPEVPGPVTQVLPADLATAVNEKPTFTWTAAATGGVPTGYKVYCDTNADPTTLITTVSALTYTFTTALNYETTYYWKVISTNGAGDSAGNTVRSFTTRANPTISTFPYTQNFDSVTAPALPLNWSVTEGTAGASQHWKTATTDTHGATAPNSGTNFAYLYCFLANTTYNPYSLITPPIALDATAKRLSYYYWIGDATVAEPLFVDVSTDLTNWTTLYTHSNAANTLAWHQNTLSLSAYASSTVYLRFRGVSNYGSNLCDLGIDDIVVEDIPAAPIFTLSPTTWDFGAQIINTNTTKQFSITNTGGGTLTVSSIGITGDYFTLTANGAPASLAAGQSATFTVQYAPTAVGTHTGTVTINDSRAQTQVTLNGSCFDPTIVSFPHTENFDGTWSGTPAAPTGWTVINSNADGYTWRQANTYITPTHSPLYAAVGMGNTDDWMITPPITFADNSRLKWWDRVESASYVNTYTVLVSTTDSAIGSFTTTLGTFNCANTAWTEHTLDLSAYTGSTVYLAFHQTASPSTYYGFGIDDFLLEEIPLAPIVNYTPSTINFGTTQATNPTAYTNVVLSNTGAGTLSLAAGDISLIGTNADQFDFTTTTGFPAALTTGQSVNIPVRFNPTTVGAKTATLRISYSGINYDVALSGSALSATALYESFEGASFPPAGWSISNGGDANTWAIYTSPRTGVNAAGILYDSSTAHDDWLITPPLTVSTGDASFSFWAKNGSSTYLDQFNVKLSTTTNAVASFTNTLASAITPGTTYTQYSYDLTPYIGQNVYVAVQAISLDMLYLYVDDFSGPSVYSAPVAPDAVTLVSPADAATGMLVTGFDLTWTPASTGGLATYYAVYMSMNEETIYDDEYFETPGTSFNPTPSIAFNYGETWYWTVEAINTYGSTVVEPAHRFQIQADPTLPITVFPYLMDFEANGDNSLPPSWSRTSNSTGWEFGSALSSSYWTIPSHTVYAAANDDAAGDGADGSVDMLISPYFDFSGTYDGIPLLTFDSFYDGGYGLIATVEASTNGTDWTVIKTLTAGTAWVSLGQSLAAYDGMTGVQLRFHADDAGEWASGWAIDNISVSYVNIDLMEPVVDHYPIIGWPLVGSDIAINALVTDDTVWNSGIASVTLNYTINGGTETQIPMSLVEGYYQANIPGQVAGTLVAYNITAVDASAQSNTVTSDTWDFNVNSPVWMQYDAGTITSNLGLSTGTFGIMTGFENPFGAGNPVQINSIFGRFNGATTANVHVYTYDSATSTFTDVIPSFNQAFLAATDTVIPLTNCTTTVGYFYVALTDIVGPMYFALDGTQAYYPGTHFINFGAGDVTVANLGTVEGSGYPGSWFLRANIEAGTTALDAPVVTIGTNGTLGWTAVAGASSYRIKQSDDPFGTFTVAATVTAPTTQWLDPTFGAAKKFYQVIASSDTPSKGNVTKPSVRDNKARHIKQAPKASFKPAIRK